MAPIFREGGFLVANSGRRLMGVYEIFGFFRFIESLDVFNLPKDEPKPSLPEGDHRMDLMVGSRCMGTWRYWVHDTRTACMSLMYYPGVQTKQPRLRPRLRPFLYQSPMSVCM